MSEKEPGTNRNGNEPSSRNQNEMNASRRKVPDVNFDEMNFEQRRAPYDSGKRNIDARMYDCDRVEKRQGRKRDDC